MNQNFQPYAQNNTLVSSNFNAGSQSVQPSIMLPNNNHLALYNNTNFPNNTKQITSFNSI